MMRKPKRKIKDPTLARRVRRKLSIRTRIAGTSERPRLCVVKTNKHLSVQAIDDDSSVTICSVQTYGKNAVEGAKKNREGAKQVGAKLAAGLKAKNIDTVVFDRNGYRYTGVIAIMADSIRENGIKF
jgi:large subunit ribosomal protein L18